MTESSPSPRLLLLPVAVFVLVAVGIASGHGLLQSSDERRVNSFPPLAEGEEAILFVGDTLLAGGTASENHLSRDGSDWMFQRMAPLLESAHAVAIVGNLEGPITKSRRKGKPSRSWNYAMAPKFAPALKEVGFTHLSLANNHALDRRRKGMYETIDALKLQGIVPFGGGHDPAEANRPAVIEAGGARVAIVGGMQPFRKYVEANWEVTAKKGGITFFDKEAIPRVIKAARREADLVVAYPHWGDNYKPVRGRQERVARRLVAAKVDAIVGHHGHAAQQFGPVDGVPVLWGLGNFAFGTPGRFGHDKMQPGYGLVTRLVVADRQLKRFEIVPIRINNRLQDYQPYPAARTESQRVLEGFAKAGGATIRVVDGVGIFDIEANRAAPAPDPESKPQHE